MRMKIIWKLNKLLIKTGAGEVGLGKKCDVRNYIEIITNSMVLPGRPRKLCLLTFILLQLEILSASYVYL